jgi:hypothetical protein
LAYKSYFYDFKIEGIPTAMCGPVFCCIGGARGNLVYGTILDHALHQK